MTLKFTQNSNRKSLRKQKSRIVDEIVRVDHAGEFGAKRIYMGQLAVLKNNRKIKEMYEQELEHLSFFEQEIAARGTRPTLLYPLWNLCAYAMGYITAKMGTKAAMACTVAVEEVIGGHYEAQINAIKHLEREGELLAKIERFRNEELEHHDAALLHGAEEAKGFVRIKAIISAITKSAIAVSKKI